ncbi:MAG: hypothetical protein WCS49_03205 [Bacilli bacterium]
MSYEKVSVNVEDKSLAYIDLLIADGFYANRSDFINQAIESQISKEIKNIDKLINLHTKNDEVDENQWFFGIANFNKEFLEKAKLQNKKLNINGFGVLSFSFDCSDELIFATIKSISKRIKIHANKSVIGHYKK